MFFTSSRVHIEALAHYISLSRSPPICLYSPVYITDNVTNNNASHILHPDVWSCDFEAEDKCNYEQLQTDQFDWTRYRGRTTTGNTGPNIDHTTNTAQGYYLYIETSKTSGGSISSSNQNGAKAILRTSRIPIVPGCSYELEFWYSMYGRAIGALSVQVGLEKPPPAYVGLKVMQFERSKVDLN
ncbi:MAM domain-containing glycosylphosphatidylinositol anchor protein 1 [Elysia marginata]|uniref:MAM domain-containing glycosylphosphatidylinositol anchor protein 1 n=1 Tax=Elysia marginata TaxID=1093978 RepID=A0AAV4J0R8_9GAST|nr:MAM domain-containing glycosylphosphatidylinositol anchor protein 1 [Elysia marginata]